MVRPHFACDADLRKMGLLCFQVVLPTAEFKGAIDAAATERKCSHQHASQKACQQKKSLSKPVPIPYQSYSAISAPHLNCHGLVVLFKHSMHFDSICRLTMALTVGCRLLSALLADIHLCCFVRHTPANFRASLFCLHRQSLLVQSSLPSAVSVPSYSAASLAIIAPCSSFL